MERRKAILQARRTWNAAAHKARELTEADAADELYVAAEAILVLLTPHVEPTAADDQ